MKIRLFIVALVLTCVNLILLHQMPFFSLERETKETFTGTIVGIGGQLGGVTRSFTLTLEGHTSSEDVQRVANILKSNGQDALLEAIRKEKLGRFSVDGNVGRDINIVRERKTDHGRKITLVYERWLQMFEVRYGTRSEDYPFGYAELYIDDNGRGEGTLIPAAKIYFDDKAENTIVIENFGIYPARLANVQLRTK